MNRTLLTGAVLAVLVGACSSSSSTSTNGKDGNGSGSGDDTGSDGGASATGDGGTSTSNDAGTTTKDSGSSEPKCDLFTCNTSADCGGIAPCFSTSTGANYCYEQEGSPDECSNGTTAITKETSNGATTICVPSTCPQPVNFLE